MDSVWLQEKSSPSPLSSTPPPQSPSRPTQPKWHKKSPKRKPSSAWADQVEESVQQANNKAQHKKQCIGQIMGWPKAKPKPKTQPLSKSAPPALGLDFYKHKDGDKTLLGTLVACGDDGRTLVNKGIDAGGHSPRTTHECDAQSCDTSSCDDSHSCDTLSGDSMSCETLSSCDALSCDTLSNDSSEGKKKKKHKKKKKRNYSAAEEGKKVFVGGVGFEDCDALLSNENETLAMLRHQKFAQIFYLFGQVNRIQGHWDSGYCFVVYSTRKAAKLAIKCLSMATVRRKVVQSLRDNVGPSGMLPLPSFYVRWANNPSKSPAPAASQDSEPCGENEAEDKEVEWVHAVKEDDMVEADVERLMHDLKKLQCVAV